MTMFLAFLAQAGVWVNDWYVFKAENACVMATEYEAGTRFLFSHDWHTNEIRVSISDERWKSLGDRNGEEVRVEYKLSGRNVAYDEWWADRGLIVADKEAGNYAVTAWWDGEKHGKDFWPAWALADGVEVKIDGRVVGRYELRGSYNASLSLLKCSASALKTDRSDPFAN